MGVGHKSMALLQPANDDFSRKLHMDFNLEMSLIRAMLLLSLSLQLALVMSGYFRKMTNRYLVTIPSLSYLCYLAAEPAATTALAMILRATPTPLALLWTTFLLWHLGGPYNLTAYAVQDSETWTRHLLFFFMRLGTALYVCFKLGKQNNSPALIVIAVLMLLAGTIKYAERIWALWTATTAQLVSRIFFGHQEVNWRDEEELRRFLEKPRGEELKFLCRAYLSFMVSRLSFLGLADSHLHFLEGVIKDETHPTIHTSRAQRAFRLVGIQLELLHDTLYTKFPMPTIKYWRLSTNVIYILTLIASLLVFSTIADHHKYEPIDILLTYFLLCGTILLECVSITMQIFSTWSMVNLNERLISHLQPLKQRLQTLVTPRKDVCMGQHDLLQQCFNQRLSRPMQSLAQTSRSSVATILNVKSIINRFYHSKLVTIDDGLKEYIYSYVTDSRNQDSLKYLLQQQQSLVGLSVFQHQQLHFMEQVGMDFVEFIVHFHIMTNVLYHRQTPSDCDPGKAAKHISDYMMYLALVHPLMLPKGLTCDVIYKRLIMEVNRLYHNNSRQTITEFARQLYDNPTQPSLPEAEGRQRDKLQYSMVLQRGGLLLQELQRQLLPPNSPHISTSSLDQQAWDTISKMWTDLLAYAAVCCGWKEHVQQLKDGGELLTYVALLMLQLGFDRKTPL